ncbi:MAG TPA: HisA/HisF-related TIM barrel protein, partial [Gaiella sp.]
GTAALTPGFLEEAVERFGDSVVVAVDVRGGRVVVEGWTEASELAPGELAERCAALGVARLLVTSAARDGSLAGPDLALVDEVAAAGLPVLAAGGIASLDDLRALRRAGCEGAVVGSALLAGRFTLAEALAVAAE